MRIAVVSDTHDRYPAELVRRLRAADEIWHLGDVCDPGVLREFEQIGPPVRVVRGNCDSCELWPLELSLIRGGTTFLLTHIPPPVPPRGARVILHGHTHVPRDEERDGVRWLNPGCITRPRGSGTSFAWLTVGRDGGVGWKLVPLPRSG